MKCRVRILERDRFGTTVAIFTDDFTATTKQKARKLARAKYRLPKYTLGNVWQCDS